MVARGSSASIRPPGQAEILRLGDGLVLARVGTVCIAIWRSDSNLARVALQREALARVVQQAPGTAGFLCVVEKGSAPPNEEARKASAQMLEEHGERLRAVAVVIEGSGFRASIVRSVASSIVWIRDDAARRRSRTSQRSRKVLIGYPSTS